MLVESVKGWGKGSKKKIKKKPCPKQEWFKMFSMILYVTLKKVFNFLVLFFIMCQYIIFLIIVLLVPAK